MRYHTPETNLFPGISFLFLSYLQKSVEKERLGTKENIIKASCPPDTTDL